MALSVPLAALWGEEVELVFLNKIYCTHIIPQITALPLHMQNHRPAVVLG